MTTANKITVVRILMIPVFVTMAIYYGQSIQRGEPLEWQRFTAIAIFLIAAVSDGLDGYVARRYKQRSALGAILDPIADKGLLLSAIITLSISNWSDIDPEYGRFPAWFPVLVITRDAVILVGAGILHLLNGKVHVKPSWTGKVATVLQMGAIAWVMLQLHFLSLLYVVIAAGVVAGKGESELPRQVRHAVEEAIHDSDLLLFLVDAKQGLSPLDQELAQMLRKSQKPVVLVINKIDTEKHENLAIDFASLGFSESLSISAAHSRGISELIETIDQLLPSPSTTDQSPGASHQSL